MTRTRLWATAALILAAALAPSANGQPPLRSCNAPHPKFQSGTVKIYATTGRLRDRIWWVCSARLRTPHVFNDDGTDIRDSNVHFRRFGHRVAYFWRWDGGGASG